MKSLPPFSACDGFVVFQPRSAGLQLPGSPSSSALLLHSGTSRIATAPGSPAPWPQSAGATLLSHPVVGICRCPAGGRGTIPGGGRALLCSHPERINGPKCRGQCFYLEKVQAVQHEVNTLSRFAQDSPSFCTERPASRETPVRDRLAQLVTLPDGRERVKGAHSKVRAARCRSVVHVTQFIELLLSVCTRLSLGNPGMNKTRFLLSRAYGSASRSGNVFCKEPHWKYLWLCRPYSLCRNYSALWL